MPTLPWTSPKAMPLAEGAVTVMASHFELRRRLDALPFLIAAVRVKRQMLASPGAMGVSLVAKPLRRTFWTLSAWQDEAALRATVGGEPHRRVMRQFRPRMAGSSFVTWSTDASALPVGWDEALRRLEEPDTVHDRRVGPGR